MLGAILVKITFASTLFSVILYFFNFRKHSDELLKYARQFYYIAVSGFLIISGMMLYFILTHQFQYYYVWAYSSTDLPLPLLVSTFYAGQEGSFMLWALYTSIIGLFLIRYSSKKGYETELMLVYTTILSFLLLMLLVKNPFKFIWEQFPDELYHVGPVPPDVLNYAWIDKARALWATIPVEGKGLNPLLQNYWMAIHPQILFIGFTAMSIPFAYAVAAMLKRDYVSWIRVAAPWTIFGALALGSGIIIGGYWAYETLGWGGYWGWDPVENSSLVPWLVCVASIHTMLAQRKNGTYIKTNFVLSLLCFILVLYSTFLTRSGVLGDTSVHSFVDPGMWVYWLLLMLILIFAVIGFGLFAARWKEMPVVPVEHTFVSREFALFLGASALVISSIFILIGTSSPIITSILKGKTSAVDISYYITTTLPLGVIIALLSGIGQLLWWKRSDGKTLLHQLILPSMLALLLTLTAVFMGAHHPAMIIFIFAASIGLFANLIVGARIIKGNPKMAGGAITHIGIALMFLGFVSSEKYDSKETLNLEEGKTVNALGYSLKYIGYKPLERGRFAFNVEVEKNGKKFIVAPVMFEGESEGSVIRNPDIINLGTKDFYLSPLALEAQDEHSSSNEVTLMEKESVEKDGMKIEYLGYKFSQSAETGNFIQAQLKVTQNGKTEILTPTLTNNAGKFSFTEAKLKNSNVGISIKILKPGNESEGKSSITISLSGIPASVETEKAPQRDVLVVEASIKPFINLVWIGTFSLMIGFVITIVRRAKESLRFAEKWK
ncbi:MAG: cytochrome c biogenesis protein CcsA [Bacteroidetes bacterium]|nr:cytochrome c biogenesis protein CcsA [Bacteroidota bacterium]